MTKKQVKMLRAHVKLLKAALPGCSVDHLNGNIRAFGTAWDTWGDASAEVTILPESDGLWKVIDHGRWRGARVHTGCTWRDAVRRARAILLRRMKSKAHAAQKKADRMRATLNALKGVCVKQAAGAREPPGGRPSLALPRHVHAAPRIPCRPVQPFHKKKYLWLCSAYIRRFPEGVT